MQVCSGLPISQGLAAGKIVFLGTQKATVRQAVSPQEEQLRFESAQRQAVDALGALYEKARAELGEKDAEIFSVHQLMAEDEDFTDLVSEAIADGAEAAEAVRQAGEQCAAMFSAMDDDYMRERAADVRDVAARICRILNGEAEQTITEPCLIAAEELTPSQTVQFPREFVRGMLTARGAANSHMGILARTLGVPAVSQLPVSAELHGRTAVLDGFSGTLTLDPDEQTLAEAAAKIAAQQAQREALRQLISAPSVTRDGHSVRLYANIAGTDDLPLLRESGAEGVGLLRSEFLYLGRSTYPTEDELFESYKTVVQAMDGREVIIRTLDIGADKQVGYFDMPPEDNPALGLRAIRLCLTRPILFQTQLCAILRASRYGTVGIMFPMVTGPDELHRLKQALADAEDVLIACGERFGPYRVGVMIETPAAVFMSGELAGEVDFFSIGTNDLIQYTVAVDRGNKQIEKLYDYHHPAVLRLIAHTIASAAAAGIPCCMCGEAAGEEDFTQALLGCGLMQFSVSAGAVAGLKKRICDSSREAAKSLFAQLEAMKTAEEITRKLSQRGEDA